MINDHSSSRNRISTEFHRCSIQDNNMADIKSNKKSINNLRHYFREYCDYTGIHGLKYIGEKRSLLEKICWTIIFGLSLTTCISVVYEVFKKWQRSPIIVNFASEQVNIFDITFPAVTICPETQVYSDHFNYSFILRRSLNESISKDELKKLQYMSLLCNVNMYYHKIPKIDTIDEGFYEFLKNGAPFFLTKCNFMGEDHPCEQIFQPIYTDGGLCVTFNMLSKKQMFTEATANIEPPPDAYQDRMATNWSADFGYAQHAGVDAYPRRALLSGSRNSLEVSFAINNTDLDYGCTHLQGYKVLLHSPRRFPLLNTHSIRIPLRKSVSIAITPQLLNTSESVAQYPIRKRKCFFQTDAQLKYFSKYSQLNCRLECLLNLTMDMCGCVEYYMPRSSNMPICGTGKYECVKNALAQHTLLLMKHNLDVHATIEEREKMNKYFGNSIYNISTTRHLCPCPDMCNNLDYNVEITESDYDWPRKMATLGVDVITEDQEGLSSSQLLLYFKGSTFIPLERNALFETFDFLANVGGLLGLFIGFSLLSMIELVYFLSLRIICNLKLYKTWYGPTGVKPTTNPVVAAVLKRTSSSN
ncbi:unnamed protein product [Ceutorhynchus assimilis]|uniref:Uncharacterized protein n=1 Tax=Ceutorhynchus assimilis TaxID=467358 RepID=A0A9N9MPS2_9CUCU|nr:unnamed protein product [Ceutorhynchus assimilis]